MANVSVTYTFVNGTSADGTEVSTNFTDLVNGTSDGTKDFTINALTTNSDITMGGDLLPDAANTRDIGSTTKTLVALYLDNSTNDGGAIYFDAGTAEYIKASADGTQLDIGGFTSLEGSALVNRVSGWVNFDSVSGVSIKDSYNVDSVDDDGAGTFGVNWDTDFADGNYACVACSSRPGNEVDNQLADTANIITRQADGTAADTDNICVIAVGAQS